MAAPSNHTDRGAARRADAGRGTPRRLDGGATQRPDDYAVAAHQAGLPRPGRERVGRGRTAVEQARLLLLVMVNVAQLWILAATVEAALAARLGELVPLVISSGVCFLIALSLLFWWRPVSRHKTSTGYVRVR